MKASATLFRTEQSRAEQSRAEQSRAHLLSIKSTIRFIKEKLNRKTSENAEGPSDFLKSPSRPLASFFIFDDEVSRQTIFLLALIMLAGFGFRIACCFWGYPHLLHADEPTIVNSAIDMIKRCSWEANRYNRPDHFEIKCCALLFQIVSYLRYHMSADVAFSKHTTAFYLVARGYTAVFGTMMIPLGYMILEKLKKNSGLIGAVFIAFFPTFVSHSAYATPDIVLTFMVMLLGYISLLYLDSPSINKVVAMSIVTGLGITIKYTMAICGLYIAFIVILDCIRRKNIRQIFTWGFIAALVVFLTVFFMAPNLFTNIRKTIATIILEARPHHFGADGLGKWGNFRYYGNVFLNAAKTEILLFEVLGIVYLCCSRNKSAIFFLLGLLFWVCTSILSLHWERWGMPIFIFFVLMASLGISYAFDLLQKNQDKISKPIWKILKYGIVCLVCLFLADQVIFTSTRTLSALAPDTRVLALEFCQQNGITKNNTAYDGYTPFSLRGSAAITNSLIMGKDGKIGNIKLKKGQKNISYIILSSSMYGRAFRESKRYADMVQKYTAIRQQSELLAQFSAKGVRNSRWLIPDISNRIKYIYSYIKQKPATGPTVQIYKLREEIPCK